MFPATTCSRCLVLRQSRKHLRELYFRRVSTDYQYINSGGRLFSYHNQPVLTLSHRGWTILPKRYFISDIPKNEIDVTSEDVTIGGLKRRWGKCLEEEGVPESDLSVEAIVAHVLGKKMFHELDASIMTLIPTKKEKEDIDRLCHQRLKRMPVQYIISEWDFRDMTLIMKPPVFIPRSETEIFVEIITDHYMKDEELKILEIGCGSGAISVSLLRAFNKSHVTAFDVLEEAVELTQENAARYNVQDRLNIYNESVSCRVPKHLENSKFQFDLIVSNPPYIFEEDLDGLEPEVIKFEDSAALNGGRDGADVIYDIIKLSPHVLKPGGYIWLETDTRHSEILKDWLERHRDLSVQFVCCFPDFTDRPRFCQLQYVGDT